MIAKPESYRSYVKTYFYEDQTDRLMSYSWVYQRCPKTWQFFTAGQWSHMSMCSLVGLCRGWFFYSSIKCLANRIGSFNT